MSILKEVMRIVQKKATLFRFEYNGKAYCYTDFPKKILFNGETYHQAVIANDDIYSSNREPIKNSKKIEVSINNEVAKLWRKGGEGVITTYRIYEIFVNDTSTYTLRSMGEVAGYTTDNEKFIFTCNEFKNLLQATTLDAVISSECFFNIYDPLTCGLDFNDWAVQFTVLSISQDRTTLTLNSLPGNYVNFKGGIAKNPDGQVELIIDVNFGLKTITLNTYENMPVNVGDIVRLAPTCSYNYVNCRDVFNNLDNSPMFIKQDGTTPFDQNVFKNKNNN